ncbi:MAG: sulfotransferase [Tepidisphaeraceae bacterium]
MGRLLSASPAAPALADRRILVRPAPAPITPITRAPAAPSAGVLVTGSHRSGTTWVGQILGKAPGLCYLHEPFKPNWDPPYVWTLWDRYFLHIDEHNAEQYDRTVQRTLGLRFDPVRYFRRAPSVTRIWDTAEEWARWTSRRLRGRRPLVKDPIALFSAPWLHRRHGLDVVVMIRHPAAFVSSIKLKGWWFNFNHFLLQERLMSDLLYPFERDILALASRNDDLIEQAILQWRCFHHVIHLYQREHPTWRFVRHEDLSLDPLGGFRDLFGALRLDFTPECQRAVRESSDGGNCKDAAALGRSTRFCKVDSAANVRNWQHRLTADEVRRVRIGTEDVAHHFYVGVDWE